MVAGLSWSVCSDDGLRFRREHGDDVLAAQDQACAVLRLAPAWPGYRVLELGKGTGDDYTSVLLAKLVTPGGTVISVRPNHDRPALRRTVLTGPDAAVTSLAIEPGPIEPGWPAGAPYDVIISWCAVPAVPAPWLTQCRSGGLILAPLADVGWVRMQAGPDQHADHDQALVRSWS